MLSWSVCRTSSMARLVPIELVGDVGLAVDGATRGQGHDLALKRAPIGLVQRPVPGGRSAGSKNSPLPAAHLLCERTASNPRPFEAGRRRRSRRPARPRHRIRRRRIPAPPASPPPRRCAPHAPTRQSAFSDGYSWMSRSISSRGRPSWLPPGNEPDPPPGLRPSRSGSRY